LSIRTSLVLGFTLVVAAVAVRGDDACTCTGTTTDIVDMTRAPSKIEGQNKVRIEVQPERDPKTGALSIVVQGTAYYPDGVVLKLGLHHWKVRGQNFIPMGQEKVTVKDNVFNTKLGPFTKTIPAGGLVVEALYKESDQTPQVLQAIQKGHYYHSTPPCKHDRLNGTAVAMSLGGAEAEAADEQAEKKAVGKARDRILDAKIAAEKVITAVAKKEQAPKDAVDACERLEGDLRAAADEMNKWLRTRQFLLFSNQVVQLSSLKNKVIQYAKNKAVEAGATIAGFEAADAPNKAKTLQEEITKISDEIKGFLDDPHAIDSAFDAGDPDKDKKDSKDAPPAKDKK